MLFNMQMKCTIVRSVKLLGCVVMRWSVSVVYYRVSGVVGGESSGYRPAPDGLEHHQLRDFKCDFDLI